MQTYLAALFTVMLASWLWFIWDSRRTAKGLADEHRLLVTKMGMSLPND